MAETKEFIHRLVKVMMVVLPLVAILFFSYVFYIDITRNRVIETQKDIRLFTQNLVTRYNITTYRNFDSDFVSYSEYLPSSLKIRKTDHGNEIVNRFGGKMIFKESPKTLEERADYIRLLRERRMFEAHYTGLGAYTILFTELKAQECAHMAITEWKRISPHFMGMEISKLSAKHPYNGVENLNYYILQDNGEEEFESRDEGLISRTPLSMINALKACSCFGNKCTVALKFY